LVSRRMSATGNGKALVSETWRGTMRIYERVCAHGVD